MNYIEAEIKEIESVLHLIYTTIKNITDENCDHMLSELDIKIKKVNLLRNQLKNKYNKAVLVEYEPTLGALTKQIREKFDNIIEEKKTEQARIGLELADIQNKKKLLIYNR
jgi:hypothetical protein